MILLCRIGASQPVTRGRDYHYDVISDVKREVPNVDDIKRETRVYPARLLANQNRESVLGMAWNIRIFRLICARMEFWHGPVLLGLVSKLYLKFFCWRSICNEQTHGPVLSVVSSQSNIISPACTSTTLFAIQYGAILT